MQDGDTVMTYMMRENPDWIKHINDAKAVVVTIRTRIIDTLMTLPNVVASIISGYAI
jgi:hypothetical protein